MIPIAVVGGVIGAATGAVTGFVTVAVQSAPTDYVGISLIIGACGSVIGTIGGLVLMFMRRSTTSEVAEVLKAMRELEQEGGHNAP